MKLDVSYIEFFIPITRDRHRSPISISDL